MSDKASMLKTDFCIPGFPKCSTSALARFLESSPACNLSKLPRSYESPYLLDNIPTPPPSYVEGKKNGHKYAAYMFSQSALVKAFNENPKVLFIINVRPAHSALLSWRKMHAEMASSGVAGHFTTKDEAAKQFYTTCTADEYFSAYADSRLNYADYIAKMRRKLPDARFVIVSQKRLSEDARGVLSSIHELMGVTPSEDFLNSLPASHTTAGDRAAGSTPISEGVLKALQEKDDRLKSLLDTLSPEQKLISDQHPF